MRPHSHPRRNEQRFDVLPRARMKDEKIIPGIVRQRRLYFSLSLSPADFAKRGKREK